jgi:hypothetical protein
MTMKGFFKVACLAVLVVPAVALAQKESKAYGCDDVNWGPDVTSEFPNAQAACHGVTMKNGQPFAKFSTELVDANKSEATLNVLDRAGKPLSRIKVAIDENTAVKIDGANMKVAKLPKGTRMNFYVAHDKWGLYADPDSAPLRIISREDI